jgi:hypothetical protein
MRGQVGLLAVALVSLIGAVAMLSTAGVCNRADRPFKPAIPKTWDDAAMATLEVPVANPIGSPKHVSADYYYKIPVRPIYRSYPVYAPGHEPPGYMDWLKQQEPEIIWGDKGHALPLKTEADWIEAGETVFNAPIAFSTGEGIAATDVEDVRNPAWYQVTRTPLADNGILPFHAYVIRQKGRIEVGRGACAMCHTRVQPGGTIVKGAQGNFPFDRARAFHIKKRFGLEQGRAFERGTFAAPWFRDGPQELLDGMSIDEIAAAHAAIPPGVQARNGSSPFQPPHVPDLIGVEDRRYLDATGLQQHRSIEDLMRYSALNQGADDLASYAGFVPADFPDFHKLPDPDKIGGRYGDEQLYALVLFLYSLKPPPNPNRFDAVAAHGQKVFNREGCAMCHTPPLYTDNKLTLAEGFKPPPGAAEKYDILPISVGTDPNLALKTRRGTGYYKVPSLKGVWYRSMFGHSGWCAKLEDWFDPRRTRDDYVPTGFKPYGAKTFAVKGHLFGLDLSAEDRNALIAFLRTL